MSGEALRRRLLDWSDPTSARARIRARRWELLWSRFPGLAAMRVVDLGGSWRTWARSPGLPRELVIVNIDPHEQERAGPHADIVIADACDPPAAVLRRPFDLVYSNSLIEHVGGYARRRQLAAVIRDLAPHHWVQTPYRYFPIEPHWMFPGLQFLPLAVRAEISRRWPLGSSPDEQRNEPLEAVLAVELIGKTELRHLFAGSDLLVERLLGLPKSLIAVR